MKITLDDGHGRRLDSERKPRRGNRKSLVPFTRRRQRYAGIGPAKLMGLSDPSTGGLIWGPTLASQFWTNRGWSGEQKLSAGILEDALAVYRLGLTSPRRQTLVAAREAEAWLLSNEAHWPFSFLVICDTLDLDPQWIRAGIFGKEAA